MAAAPDVDDEQGSPIVSNPELFAGYAFFVDEAFTPALRQTVRAFPLQSERSNTDLAAAAGSGI
jgi:hypothetical protein